MRDSVPGLLDQREVAPRSEAVVLVLAFLAGFSERFVIAAFEGITTKPDAKAA